MAEVGAVNEQLTVLEDRFSEVLGEGARWIRDLLFVVVSAATALLLAIAGTVFIWFVRRIRRSEGRCRLLLDAAPDAIVVTDRHGRVVLFNDAAERQVGSPAASVLGEPVTSVIDLGDGAPPGSIAPPLPCWRHADVAAINAAAARAATLTRQLLAYGRQSLMRPEPVELNAVVSDIEPMIRRLIGEDMELRTNLEPGLGWVQADAGQLDQVISIWS